MTNTHPKHDLYAHVTHQVLALMAEHGADWARPWVGSGLPANAKTGAEYRGMNVVLLGAETFRQHAPRAANDL
jgi:antirestriction protein ArdC